MQLTWHFFVASSLLLIERSYAPPVDKKAPTTPAPNSNDTNIELNLEYERYLKEVVNMLESDHAFKAKLEKANPDDIKSGKIAEELDFVDHNVRSKLNEIKRVEIERLRELIKKQLELDNGAKDIKLPKHLDHTNLQTFEKDDLKKLILQTTHDLEELDKKRMAEFKQYELEKEAERLVKLENMTAEQRKAAEEEHQKAEELHNKHEKLNHPGSKDQLKEVWEEADKLPEESFDMNTFFNLHDVNSDGYLDQQELEALFQTELDKVYDKNRPEDDMREREEEAARMREHVMKEMDHDKDGIISKIEFLNEQKDPDFEKNPGWQDIDDQKPVYTPEELKAMEEQIRRMQPGYNPHMEQPHPGQQQQVPYQQVPPQGQYQGQVPPGQYQVPPQQYQQPPQYPPPQGQYQQQQPVVYPPPQQVHPNAVPQAQWQHQAAPVQQQQPVQYQQQQQQYQAQPVQAGQQPVVQQAQPVAQQQQQPVGQQQQQQPVGQQQPQQIVVQQQPQMVVQQQQQPQIQGQPVQQQQQAQPPVQQQQQPPHA